MDKPQLPVIKNKKKINTKKFQELAKKVRESLKEEERYMKEKLHENCITGGFSINS